ncbi:MAG: phosphotransferase, partial [Candidatus Dormibacteria bacterium]
SMIAIADSLRTLNAGWFTNALRDAGHATAAVTAVSCETMAFRGAIADMARVRLDYDGSGEPGPASLVAKIRGTTGVQVAMDGAMGLYEREARFYRQLAGEVPVATPRCYHIGDGTATPLLLEDLGALRIGDQMRGLAPADAELLMDALADLHARYWESPVLEQDWLLSPGEGAFAGMVAQLVSSGVDTLRARHGDRVPARVLDAIAQAAPRWQEILGRCAEGPMTLVHNDCRLDNIFFHAGGEPVFVDWQVVARTRGTQDVANLLAGSMDVADLGARWEALLRRYHDRLRENGIRDYEWGECVRHYRQNILYPLGAGIALLGHLDIGDDRGLGDAIVLRALS